ncbi:hypothetical protein HDE_05740 [Halotydeus destructor]|nr:hypothetical protein HDE_05740 [Halotydeus destructor]
MSSLNRTLSTFWTFLLIVTTVNTNSLNQICSEDDPCDQFQTCYSLNDTISRCQCDDNYEQSADSSTPCKGYYDAACVLSSDCVTGLRCGLFYPDLLLKCTCPTNQVYISSTETCHWKVGLNGDCKFTDQCRFSVENSYCGRNVTTGNGTCLCRKGFLPYNRACRAPNDNRSLVIYKTTMVFASIVLGVVLFIFVGCVLTKSYCPSEPRYYPRLDPDSPDFLSAFNSIHNQPPFNVRPPFEKPPTYDESQLMARLQMGIPPPSYPVTPVNSRAASGAAASGSSEPGTSGEPLASGACSSSNDTRTENNVQSSNTTSKVGKMLPSMARNRTRQSHKHTR